MRRQSFGICGTNGRAFIGFFIGRSVSDVLGEFSLVLRLANFIQEFHSQGFIGRTLGHAEAVVILQALVKCVRNLRAVLGDHIEAAIPSCDHVHFAILHQLCVLRTR